VRRSSADAKGMGQAKTATATAYAGVELGGTKILCRLVGTDGRVLANRRFATSTPEQAIADLAGCLREGLQGRRLSALAVASFGPIGLDPAARHYGRLLGTPKAGWSGFDVRSGLLAHFPGPFVIDTDVNAAALAEQASGAGRGLRSVAYVTVGTGIGGGVAIEGVTLKGSLHPEIGHMRLRRRDGDHAASTCPFHEDCAEGLAAGPAVARRLGPGHTLEQEPQTLDLVAAYLGDLMANLTLAWSPQRIVAGGGVMAVPGLLAKVAQGMRANLGGYGGEVMNAAGYLAPAQLQDAGLEGAIMLAREASAGQDL
jgi:fructokinase